MKYATTILIALVALVNITAAHAAPPDAKQIVSMQAKHFTLPDTIEMVRIPAGTFVMGSPKDEVGRGEDETQRTITISKPFYMAKVEIKENQYLPIMRPGYKPLFKQFGRKYPELHQNGPWDPPKGIEPGSQAMDAVQWLQAVELCEKLTAREGTAGRLPEGYEYRLPTEAEWEYACRAGSKGGFSNEHVEKAAKAGRVTKSINAFGLSDMHMGQVHEWVLDDYAPYKKGDATDSTGSPQADPVAFSDGRNKVLRGGFDYFRSVAHYDPIANTRKVPKKVTEKDYLRYVRSASRIWKMPAWPYAHVGFRPVLAPRIEVPKPTIDPKYNLGTVTPEDSRLREEDLIEFRGTKKRHHAAELP
ncbi:MAG: formylglycine-generating enzyme family protein [Kiritimatiellia bacterium]|jgi:formylglycine-generating enzyme required for sulfatase activity|nr:formylglycine-generating enzyme family protein [Kiritimatiellia bacterium]